MYLRQSKQKRADGREITYLQLAENVWDVTKGRSQAQIVFNCGRRGSTVTSKFRPFSEGLSSAGAGLRAATVKVLWWHVCNSHPQT